jgi:hypothetical protein
MPERGADGDRSEKRMLPRRIKYVLDSPDTDVGREYETRHADAKGCCPSTRIRSGDDVVDIHPARGVNGERSERGYGQRESHM